jgi:hypothetical protein
VQKKYEKEFYSQSNENFSKLSGLSMYKPSWSARLLVEKKRTRIRMANQLTHVEKYSEWDVW